MTLFLYYCCFLNITVNGYYTKKENYVTIYLYDILLWEIKGDILRNVSVVFFFSPYNESQ